MSDCGFHHWETYKETDEYRIEPGGKRSYLTDGGGFDIFNKVKKKCQHEGCKATKEEWIRVNNIRGHYNVAEAQKLIEELCNLGL